MNETGAKMKVWNMKVNCLLLWIPDFQSAPIRRSIENSRSQKKKQRISILEDSDSDLESSYQKRDTSEVQTKNEFKANEAGKNFWVFFYAGFRVLKSLIGYFKT